MSRDDGAPPESTSKRLADLLNHLFNKIAPQMDPKRRRILFNSQFDTLRMFAEPLHASVHPTSQQTVDLLSDRVNDGELLSQASHCVYQLYSVLGPAVAANAILVLLDSQALVPFTGAPMPEASVPEEHEIPKKTLVNRCERVSELEQRIVPELLYLMQGYEGFSLMFNEDHSSLVFDATVDLPPTTKDFVRELGSLAIQYQQLMRFIQEPHVPLTEQAFVQSLTVYFSQFSLKLSDISGQERGFIELRAQLVEFSPIFDLYLAMSHVLTSQSPPIGALHSRFWHHGDRGVNVRARRIILECLDPYLGMMGQWLSAGSFQDPGVEFFVEHVENPSDTAIFNKKLVPPFFNREMAHILFEIGSNVRFVRFVCGMQDYTLDFNEREMKDAVLDLLEGNDLCMSAFLEDCQSRISKFVKRLLVQKFHFFTHLTNIYQFVFLQNGSFALHFHSALSDVSKDQIYQFSSALRHAIHLTFDTHEFEIKRRTGSLRFDSDEITDVKSQCAHPAYVLQNLDIVIRADVPSIDTIRLTYALKEDQALRDTFFRNFSKQRDIFAFFWKIFRMQRSVYEAWSLLRSTQKQLYILERAAVPQGELPSHEPLRKGLASQLRILSLLQSQLSGLVDSLSMWAHNDVLSDAWQRFWASVDDATSLSGLIEAHETFVETVHTELRLDLGTSTDLEREYIAGEATDRTFNAYLDQLVAYVLRFKRKCQSLYSDANDYANRLDDFVTAYVDRYDGDLEELSEYKQAVLEKQGQLVRLIDRFRKDSKTTISDLVYDIFTYLEGQCSQTAPMLRLKIDVGGYYDRHTSDDVRKRLQAARRDRALRQSNPTQT